jgi:hypothetical protein
MTSALVWAVGIVGVEFLARHFFSSRARAWLAAYGSLLVVVLLTGAELGGAEQVGFLWLGVVLALVGYPLGRALFRDKPHAAPSDSWPLDALSVGLLVPVAEELLWGAKVEPTAGVLLTAGLFALKHVVIDGRWKRVLGLALFWLGLSMVRADHASVALVLHVAVNQAGVALGHKTKKDQF